MWPEPTGPVWTIFCAKVASTGRARSKSASLPPAMTSSVPASASLGVRDSGASTSAIPLADSSVASRIVDDGSEVEQSQIRIGRPALASPFGPCTMASTCALPVTQRMTMSQRSASSRAEPASSAPSAISSSAASRRRWARMVSG